MPDERNAPILLMSPIGMNQIVKKSERPLTVDEDQQKTTDDPIS